MKPLPRYRQAVREIQMKLFAVDAAIYEFQRKQKELKARLARLGVGTKVCTKCGIECDIDQFYRDRQKPDGKAKWCIECVTKGERERNARRSNERRDREAA